jgi:hypothetical protein
MLAVALLALGTCPGASEGPQFAGRLSNLVARADGGLALVPSTDGGRRVGSYLSPIFEVQASDAWAAIRFESLRPTGLALPGVGTSDVAQVDRFDMSQNRLLLSFDEASLNTPNALKDRSGLAHHGSADGSVYTAPGIFGQAADLDGGCIVIEDAPSLRPTNKLTLAVWFLSRNPTRAQGLIAKRAGYQVRSTYALTLDRDGTLLVDFETENNRLTSNTVIPANTWQLAVATFDGDEPTPTRTKLSLNGRLDTVGMDTDSSFTSYADPLVVGCLPLQIPDRQAFDGLIDEVAIWHRALSATEVEALYLRGATRHRVVVRACESASSCNNGSTWFPADGGDHAVSRERHSPTISLYSVSSPA